MIIVGCDRIDCDETFEVGLREGSWMSAPRSVENFALHDTDFGALIYLYLPAGWTTSHVELNAVIHCPNH